MNLSTQIHIERDEVGDYLITWTESFSAAPVDVYASTSPDEVANGELVHSGAVRTVRIDQLREPQRHYFHLRPQDRDGVTMAERVLPLRGGTNFRDFGGYLNEEGRQVKWGRLYRSGHMARLSDEDIAYLAELAIKRNCDFRRETERRNEPTRLPDHTEIIDLTVSPGSIGDFFAKLGDEPVGEDGMVEAMAAINRELVLEHKDRYRRMFEELLALEDGAFLINCSAGKDRTGFAAALILAALGVPRETILHDYMLSARYYPIEREMARLLKKYSVGADGRLTEGLLKPLMEVREDYLLAAFETIDECYDSIECFLEQAYGVGPQKRQLLRQRLTV